MASNKPDPSCVLATVEDLKALRREIQSQHSTLGLHIATLDARISTLESQLRDYVGRGSEETSSGKSNIAQVDKTQLADGSALINLKVSKLSIMDGGETFFNMSRHTQMEKLMTAWCDHLSMVPEDVVFLFEDHRLQTYQTPEQLKMEDGDEILVLPKLKRGSCGTFM